MEGKRCITVGVLAHVDAGKTTLTEGMLYLSGKLRKQGRVDHGDTYLDSDPMERERGITIFSKQARLAWKDLEIVLLDTPGHTDFSPETERTLRVLDYAILVISAPDGVQSHTVTLWKLLEAYHVPTFLFVNKTDLPNRGLALLEKTLKEKLDPAVFPVFPAEREERTMERLAETSEELIEPFLENGYLTDPQIASAVASRTLFPCFFGAALRLSGIEEMMDGIVKWTLAPEYPESFSARVYKIWLGDGQRLTWMKVTGGKLSVRDEIRYTDQTGKPVREKIAQIRLYSGEKFTQTDVCPAGQVCTVLGLSATYAGQGLGDEADGEKPLLEPVLTYLLRLPEGTDPALCYPKLKTLEEEDPTLRLVWTERTKEIHAQLMGQVQIEVLQRMARERFGLEITPDTGKILYRETLSHAAEGVGHYEPLRHYAEVHLLLEPLPRGSGLIFDTRCPEEQLAKNWQRLILTHLSEKTHVGVLTGSPLTDLKITVLTGRAHLKHTEGGDFREATYRAVRQGAMQVPSVLLEPYYRFTLEIPTPSVGKAMTDLERRAASFTLEEGEDGFSRLTGRAPVSEMTDYAREISAYTHGQGRISFVYDGYDDCRDPEKVLAGVTYSPTADPDNPCDSVFCEHGAGYSVPWDQVRAHMHVDSGFSAQGKRVSGAARALDLSPLRSPKALAHESGMSEDELQRILERTFGPMRRRQYAQKRIISSAKTPSDEIPKKKELLILDGYNLLFAWDALAPLAEDDPDGARKALMDTLSSYVAYTKADLLLVFDAYRVKGAVTTETEHDGYRVVFTAENETADTYIEKYVHGIGKNYSVRVVTSDRLIQISALGAGVLRMSAREFIEEIERTGAEITDFLRRYAEAQE